MVLTSEPSARPSASESEFFESESTPVEDQKIIFINPKVRRSPCSITISSNVVFQK